jgi:hypothetical protein
MDVIGILFLKSFCGNRTGDINTGMKWNVSNTIYIPQSSILEQFHISHNRFSDNVMLEWSYFF